MERNEINILLITFVLIIFTAFGETDNEAAVGGDNSNVSSIFKKF